MLCFSFLQIPESLPKARQLRTLSRTSSDVIRPTFKPPPRCFPGCSPRCKSSRIFNLHKHNQETWLCPAVATRFVPVILNSSRRRHHCNCTTAQSHKPEASRCYAVLALRLFVVSSLICVRIISDKGKNAKPDYMEATGRLCNLYRLLLPHLLTL